jgi:hypothetical protein
MADEDDLGSFEAIEEAETFLGGLRSELDEGSHLHPTFAAMSAAADAVRASYLSYAITPTKAAEAFRLLRIVDDNDIEWTVGPSSGSWFRRRVGSAGWQPGPPPLMAEPKPGSTVPWLSSELADLLPSARSANATEERMSQGTKAGIRVVDAAELPKVDEGESRDWLLAEWDELEVHLDVMRQQAQPFAASAVPEATSTADASPVESQPEEIGLPAATDMAGDPEDMLSLFVPPEPRRDAVELDDILERGPVERTGAATDRDITENPHASDSTAGPAETTQPNVPIVRTDSSPQLDHLTSEGTGDGRSDAMADREPGGEPLNELIVGPTSSKAGGPNDEFSPLLVDEPSTVVPESNPYLLTSVEQAEPEDDHPGALATDDIGHTPGSSLAVEESSENSPDGDTPTEDPYGLGR